MIAMLANYTCDRHGCGARARGEAGSGGGPSREVLPPGWSQWAPWFPGEVAIRLHLCPRCTAVWRSFLEGEQP